MGALIRCCDKGLCGVRTFSVNTVGGVVEYCSILGGCPGNTQAICRLVTGMPVVEVVEKLKGIRCDGRESSCPNELAITIEEA